MICRSEQVSGKVILDTAFVGLNIITELTHETQNPVTENENIKRRYIITYSKIFVIYTAYFVATSNYFHQVWNQSEPVSSQACSPLHVAWLGCTASNERCSPEPGAWMQDVKYPLELNHTASTYSPSPLRLTDDQRNFSMIESGQLESPDRG